MASGECSFVPSPPIARIASDYIPSLRVKARLNGKTSVCSKTDPSHFVHATASGCLIHTQSFSERHHARCGLRSAHGKLQSLGKFRDLNDAPSPHGPAIAICLAGFFAQSAPLTGLLCESRWVAVLSAVAPTLHQGIFSSFCPINDHPSESRSEPSRLSQLIQGIDRESGECL
jgi:hypothetical protein